MKTDEEKRKAIEKIVNKRKKILAGTKIVKK